MQGKLLHELLLLEAGAEAMIDVGSKVWVPRSNGCKTIAQVERIILAAPTISDQPDMASVFWYEEVPSNIAYPIAHAVMGHKKITMVKVCKGKFVPLSTLKEIPCDGECDPYCPSCDKKETERGHAMLASFELEHIPAAFDSLDAAIVRATWYVEPSDISDAGAE